MILNLLQFPGQLFHGRRGLDDLVSCLSTEELIRHDLRKLVLANQSDTIS